MASPTADQLNAPPKLANGLACTHTHGVYLHRHPVHHTHAHAHAYAAVPTCPTRPARTHTRAGRARRVAAAYSGQHSPPKPRPSGVPVRRRRRHGCCRPTPPCASSTSCRRCRATRPPHRPLSRTAADAATAALRPAERHSLSLPKPAAPCAAVPHLRASRHCTSTTVAPSRRGLYATTQFLRRPPP